jgi:hypothetical protein
MADHEQLRFGDFKLEKATIEVRYPLALAIWDHSGDLWTEVLAKWPSAKFVQAEPSKVQFNIEDFQLSAQADQSHIIGSLPDRKLSGLANMAKPFFEIALRHLKARILTRVGLRLIYFREMQDERSATKMLLNTGLIHLPQGKYFGFEETPTRAGLNVRWESSGRGALMNLNYVGRDYEIQPPPEIRDKVASSKISQKGILLDVDFYTTSSLEIGQFGAIEWIQQGLHMMNRDTNKILGAD